MSSPMHPDTFVNAVRALGVTVRGVPGWRTHNRNRGRAYGDLKGIMIHHSVTSGEARSVDLIHDGYAGLPGPLYNAAAAKDGDLWMTGWGRANHAGRGDDDVLRAVIREDEDLPRPNEDNTDGNAWFYGFAGINLGDGEDPWPQAQQRALDVACFVICRHHRWTERSILGHREWTSSKIDPRGPGGSVNVRRRNVAALLKSGGKPAC